MKQALLLATVLASSGGLAGGAQSACSQPDVLAFVEQARQSRDLYAVGLTPDAVRQTPLASRRGGLDSRAALCSAWMLSRNPAYQPGNGQPRFVRRRQDFWVAKLAKGYEADLSRY